MKAAGLPHLRELHGEQVQVPAQGIDLAVGQFPGPCATQSLPHLGRPCVPDRCRSEPVQRPKEAHGRGIGIHLKLQGKGARVRPLRLSGLRRERPHCR
jgi:hypothetical protein